MKRLAMISVLALAFTACSAEQGPDGGATLACMKFGQVVRDASDGVLTDAELRDKLRDIDSTASVSEEVGIATHGRAMLSAATAGDHDALAESIKSFTAACVLADS